MGVVKTGDSGLCAGNELSMGHDVNVGAARAREAIRHVRAAQAARRNAFVMDACCGTATSQTGYHFADEPVCPRGWGR